MGADNLSVSEPAGLGRAESKRFRFLFWILVDKNFGCGRTRCSDGLKIDTKARGAVKYHCSRD
jgi:hypothetical protein